MLDKNPDMVKIVFKNYPLPFHQYAQPAALAAIAAQDQGKFWEFHDLLFENHNALSYQKIMEIAQQLKLDLTKFTNDMKDPQTVKILASDIKSGKEAGVTGTPSIFVNGWQLKERTFDAIQKLVNKELTNNKER